MTCIAWDGKTLAADKRAIYGGTITTLTKIRRIGDLMVGGSGESSFIGAMVEWVKNGRRSESTRLNSSHIQKSRMPSSA